MSDLKPDLPLDTEPTPDTSGGLQPYRPVSRAASLDVSTPESMAYETRQALLRLQQEVGDVDAFVARKLQYPNIAAARSFFSAEQLDAIALGIWNIERGDGLIIGDQTGIGKGRIAAGMIRYGAKNGHPTIFVTEKPTLFSDLYRDLFDIGSVELVPLIINTDPGAMIQINIDAETTVKLHEYQKNRKYLPKSMTELRELIADKDFLAAGYDFVLATYSQFSGDYVSQEEMIAKKLVRKKLGKAPASQFKTDYIAALADGAVVILDEAHNASGGESTTGYFIRERVLKGAKGCMYLSATFAKRPDNMPVYAAKTAMNHAGLSTVELEQAFTQGGVALQEIVAAELVKSGQMLRRQRSFQGIRVEYNYLPDDLERHERIYDKVIGLVNDIIDFEADFIEPVLESIGKAVAEAEGGDEIEKTRGTEQGGVNNSPFFNKTHNVIRQLLFSIKAEEVARNAIRLLGEGKKVVIAFANTMAAFMEEFGYRDGDEVTNLDFTTVLEKSLDNAMKYSVVTYEGGMKRIKGMTLGEDDLGPAGFAALEHLRRQIREVASGISISPIDVLINRIEATRKPAGVGGANHEFYRVRECTGRSFQIKEEGGVPVYRNFKANVKLFFNDFNSGEADVLLINQSASTGVSAHASAKFKDKRQRAMIIHQPELDINTEVQKRGRINRTGQVNLPEYLYISSSIPAEKRILMVLKRKLKSLDANTTGSQRASESQLESPDFFNKYGNEVVAAWLLENPGVAKQLELGSKEDQETSTRDGKPAGTSDLAEKFSRRIALLPVKEQERAYREVIEKYDEKIADLKQRGEYDLEVEYLDLRAETEGRTVLEEGSGAASPFGRPAVLEAVNARVLRRPMKWSEVQATIEKNLDGQTSESIQEQFLQEYLAGRRAILPKRLERYERDIPKQEASLEEARAQATEKPDNEKLTQKLQKAEEKLADLRAEREKVKSQFDAETNNGQSILRFFRIGRPFKFTTQLGGVDRELAAVVLQVYFKKPAGDDNRYNAANVAIIAAIFGPQRTWEITLKSKDAFNAMGQTTSMSQYYLNDILHNWNRLDTGDGQREKRFIATGNMLLAAKNILVSGNNAVGAGGKLIKYSTAAGAIRSGILLEEMRDNAGRKIQFQPITKRSVRNLPAEIMQSESGYYAKAFFVGGSALNNSLAFLRSNANTVRVTMPGTGAFKQYFSDPGLLALLYQDTWDANRGLPKAFTKWQGNLFVGYLVNENLQAFCDILADKFKLTYNAQAQEHQDNFQEEAPLPDVEAPEAIYDPLDGLLQQLEVELINDGGLPAQPPQSAPMYTLASLTPPEIARLDAVPIHQQEDIIAETGAPLSLGKAFYLIRDASGHFLTENEAAQRADAAMHRLLTARGFFNSTKPAPVVAEKELPTIGVYRMPTPEAAPTGAPDKAKRLRLAQAKAKAQAQRIRILKLQAEAA